MSGKRKLVIEILGDAKDGAKALLDVRDNADKLADGLGKAGKVGIAAGTALGGGLLYAATQAAEAEAQQLKLDNSIRNSSNTYRNNGQALKDLAQSIQGKTAADGDAIVGMQSLLVQYGYTEDKVLKLTPLVVDLSRKMGIDLDTAAKAVAKSADGSATALKRMGIDVDEAKMKADPFAATMDALRSTVGGFAEEEGQTAAGQLERIKNQLGDIVEGVGAGAIDTFSGLTTGVAGFVDRLSQANPELLNTVGRIGAIGSVASIGLGGLALIASKAIEVKANLSDANGQLGRTGRLISGLTVAGAVIGGLFTLNELLKNAGRNSVELATNLDKLSAARNGADALNLLIERTNEMDGAWEDFRQHFERTEWARIGEGSNQVRVDVEKLKKTFEDLANAGQFDQLGMALDELENRGIFGDGGIRGMHGANQLRDAVDQYRERIDAAKAAQDSNAGSLDTQSAKVDELAGDYEEAQSALEEYTNAVRATTDPLFAVLDAQDQVTAAKKRADEAMTNGDLAEYHRATMDAAQAQFNLEGRLAALKTGVDNGSVSIDVARSALQRWVGQGILTQAQADAVTNSFGGATFAAAALDQQNPYVTTGTNAGATAFQIGALKQAAEKLDDQTYWINVQARFNYTPGQLADAMRYNAAAAYGAPGRALGGPVTKDLPYVVGERGWELFVPGSNGTIISHNDVKRAAATASGPGSGAAGGTALVIQNVNIDVSGRTDPVAAGREAWGTILEYARASGVKIPAAMMP